MKALPALVISVALAATSACGSSRPPNASADSTSKTPVASHSATATATRAAFHPNYADVSAYVNKHLPEHHPLKGMLHDNNKALDQGIGAVCDAADGKKPRPAERTAIAKGISRNSGGGMPKVNVRQALVFFDTIVSGCRAVGDSAPVPYTPGQTRAIESAKQYLSMQGFSKVGLIEQLSSKYGEGFSLANATFAVNHIRVDWNQQAYRSAKTYLAMEPFSLPGLIEQLESSAGEGFTHEQAVYGATKAYKHR